MSRRKSGWVAAAGVALLLGLTACTGSDSGESAAGLAAPAQNAVPGSGSSGGSGGKSGAGGARQEPSPAKQDAQPPEQVQERKLVQTARIDMTVDDTVKAVAGARSVATANQGFTGQEETRNDRASLTLRVPADKFDVALRQLGELGTVRSQHKQADDVTEQVVDLEARLSTQRESVTRMRALLARASSVSEIAQIEGELTRRQADLESLQGRRDTLAGKVALSTVTLTMAERSAPPVAAAESGGFLSGLTDGWGAFGSFLTGLMRVVGTALPFLVAVAVPVGLVLYFRRRRRKPVVPVTEST